MSTEHGRPRSRRDKDRDREIEKEKDRHRSGKDRHKDKEKHRDRERDHDRDDSKVVKERDRDDRKVREREEYVKEKSQEREEYEKEKARLKEKEKDKKSREREIEEYEREKEKEKRRREREIEEKEKRRKEREFEEYEREKAKEKEMRREEKERARRKEKEKEREKRHREEEKERKRRDVERDEERESDRKRRKRESEESRKPNSHDEEDEQKKLEDEMEKRRRRVQEWQELKRKKEESERENGAENAENGKNWTLDGESDEEEEKSKMVIDSINGESVSVPNGEIETMKEVEVDEEEIDPLDAFMNSMVLPEVQKFETQTQIQNEEETITDIPTKPSLKGNNLANGSETKKGIKNMGRIIQGKDSDMDYETDEDDEPGLEDEDDEEFMKRVKKTKVEKLAVVDHSKIQYPPFRKSFYIEVKEITKMSLEEVASYRKELELKVHGKDVPKPIKTWIQTGLTSKLLDTIKKSNFEKPMPIQTQALPVIMSGRDCIGIAKTGSGKTLAFVLPMLRHIKDQPPVVPGDGPIALVMAPTRELVQQIHSDIRKFAKVININCVAIYGGSGVAQQISDLKRGAEIVVCTPGRMIDILCTSAGKITNLRRVTYLVMDEADRMFDMGFEPQISRIVQNTRPERQTVLFSATFPRQVEILARRVLTKPIEIQVGGRSVVNKDITQLVEVRPEPDRFLRLLELLGEWYDKGKILVFVHSQDKCDALFKDLLKHGYPCLSLHGGKDQTDRESTISDFKSNVCNLLIATSVAARGLDVKDLELVVNFDVPNHYEDYVHRVGRTGRAGKKGLAVTFISEEEERYTPDLLKALQLSEQSVPADLKDLADKFMAKVKQGTETVHGTGYGGSGFKFNEEEDDARKAAKKAQLKEYGYEEDKSDSDSDEEVVRKTGGVTTLPQPGSQPVPAPGSLPVNIPGLSHPINLTGGVPVTLPGGITLPGTLPAVVTGSAAASEATARAVALAAAINLQHNLAKIQADAWPEHYEAELEINDFPQTARWKITHKDTLGPIADWTGAAVTTRGQFYPPGRIVGPGERKLYMYIEGPTESSVKKAKAELKKVLEDFSLSLPGSAQTGKYSVV